MGPWRSVDLCMLIVDLMLTTVDWNLLFWSMLAYFFPVTTYWVGMRKASLHQRHRTCNSISSRLPRAPVITPGGLQLKPIILEIEEGQIPLRSLYYRHQLSESCSYIHVHAVHISQNCEHTMCRRTVGMWLLRMRIVDPFHHSTERQSHQPSEPIGILTI